MLQQVLPPNFFRQLLLVQQNERNLMQNHLTQTKTNNHGPSALNKCHSKPTKLIRGIGICLLALAGLLAQPVSASLGNPVTRPLLVVEGHLTIIVDPVTGDYTFTDWGWATHTGLYSNSGAGVLSLATGQFLSGSGVVIAADGDTLDWVVGPAPNQVSYTGGTGSFQGVTGGFLAVILSLTPLSNNPDGTITLAIDYDGTGTITY